MTFHAPLSLSIPVTATEATRKSDPAKATPTIPFERELAVELVMPRIYLTKDFIAWNEATLRAQGFTHIIIIDKHIQELYYPSPGFKLLVAQIETTSCNIQSDDAFDYIFPSSTLSFGKEFEAIDLNFGEKSYLTTVLPNCYKAVKFINKALQANGNVLVIDCNGGEQKCVTIVVAYLMYKHNISFNNAFARLKDFYKKADLDRFYTRQLYEYEPILQVQRAHSRGHSCSRELHSAILKRKKCADDDARPCTEEFFANLNPLSQFNVSGTLGEHDTTDIYLAVPGTTQDQQHRDRLLQNYCSPGQQISHVPIGCYQSRDETWNDCAME